MRYTQRQLKAVRLKREKFKMSTAYWFRRAKRRGEETLDDMMRKHRPTPQFTVELM